MPKRSAQEKLHHYERKIRKLREKEEQHRIQIQRSLDVSDDENDATGEFNVESQNEMEPESGPPITEKDQLTPPPVTNQTEPTGVVAMLSETEQGTTETPPSEIAAEASLDPELLSALGASTSDSPDFGDNIHDNLATLWTPLLKKGLPKENKDKLLKEYLVPGNCKFLQAPKLNAEISAAVSEVVRGRDKKFVSFQQQLGTGTSAINRAMDILLLTDNKVQALKHLSDGCRILTDLHHALTKDRIKLITPSLDKNFLHMIQDSERDDTLFGSSLSEKIKASKAIERQGSQIRKTLTNQKPAAPHSTAFRPTNQGNWSGPPRYPANRGGRGGLNHRGQRAAAPLTARRSYPSPVGTQTKNYNQPKTRAPPHQ